MLNNKKQIFYVSSRYEGIIEQLNALPNKSDFICQAIVEKLNCTSHPSNASDKDYIREQILSVLSEILPENIEKKSKVKEETKNKTEHPPAPKPSTQEHNTNISKEDAEDIKAAISNW